MRVGVVLQLGLCSLGLMLTLLRGGMGQTAGPAQVDCAWSRWSEWSPCDPCTKTRRRSRSVLVFGQFNGQSCQGSIGDREACVSNVECQQPPPPACTDTQFQCDSGSCIMKRLMCNGDFDCEDGADEDCDTEQRTCGQAVIDTNEQGRTAGYGINILGSDPRMNPFYNDYFNGRCSRAMNPYTGRYDRLPWNVGVLNYETLVEETVSKEIYEDSHSLLREILREMNFKVDAGLSFKFSPSERSMSRAPGQPAGGDEPAAGGQPIEGGEPVEGGELAAEGEPIEGGEPAVGGASAGEVAAAGGGNPARSNVKLNVNAALQYEKRTMIRDFSELTNTRNKRFMRVKGRVQLSTYRLRSRGLKVADEFLEHVKSLPLQYEKGIYFAFLEDYGTHYTKNGKSGGEYELIYVLNQDTISSKNITERKIQECLKLGITAEFSAGGLTDGNAHVNTDGCDKLTTNVQGEAAGKALVDRVMTSVKGGTIEGAVAMRAKLNTDGVMDIETYKNWARTISIAPALLNSEPEPIHMLIPLDLPEANIKISNIKQATNDYLAEYSVCKCKPCHNGGTLTLLDGKCMCLCPHLFEGVACQSFKGDKASYGGTRPTVNQEGNWQCWSAWSSCNGGRRTRTRSCNTEGLTGATCRGDTSSEEYC